MLETIAWNTFETTGNIESYMCYRELEEDENKDIYSSNIMNLEEKQLLNKIE